MIFTTDKNLLLHKVKNATGTHASSSIAQTVDSVRTHNNGAAPTASNMAHAVDNKAALRNELRAGEVPEAAIKSSPFATINISPTESPRSTLDPDRISATYFESDTDVPSDCGARDLWLQYLLPERVIACSVGDNFRGNSETPCMEIHATSAVVVQQPLSTLTTPM